MIRALITDDDPVVRMILGAILKANGYEVEDVDTGEKCLALLNSDSRELPDVLFLDFQLPDMSGPEVLSRLRKKIPPEHLPVVMLSANSEDEVKDLFLDARPEAYLTKPFNSTAVLT